MGAAAKRGQAAPPRPEPSGWASFKRATGIEDPDADAALEAEPAGAGPSRGPSWLPVALLFGLYAFALLVYVILGSRQSLPQVAPDEYQYTALARSLADGNGLTYNGGSLGIRAALYIYSIAPAWLVTDSLTQAYAVAKGMSAAMICAVVFPTWLLARRFMPPLVALVPAFLIVAGSWMTSSGQLIMENLALPLATASLAALVVTLMRPGSRAGWVALGFALLATAARAQVAVLVPIIFLALLVDIGLCGGSWRARLREQQVITAVLGVLTVIGAIVVLSKPSVLGSYSGLKANTDLGRGFPLVGRQGLAFITMSAVLPFILAVAVTLRRRAWDESQLRALLIVFWVGTIVFVFETGLLTTAFQGVTWSIQRYVEYTLPLLYVLVVAGIWRGLIATRLALIATALVALALLFSPAVENIQEQRGMFGLMRRADQLAGIGPGLTMALLALIVGGGTLLLVHVVRNRSTRAVLLAAVVGFTGIVFVVQNQAGWDWQISQARTWRKGFPKDLSWIDHATNRKLARLVAFYNPYRTPQTEIFNRRIQRTYTTGAQTGGSPVNGFTCRWSVGQTGAVTFGPGCGPDPTAFFLNDDFAKMTFYNQTVVAQKPNIGRVVTVDVTPPERVRLKSVLNPPCLAPIATQDLKTGKIFPPRPVCGSNAQGTLYLDEPAKLVLTYAGGQADQRVQVQNSWGGPQQAVVIPAGKQATVTVDVPRGANQWQAAGDWQGAPPAVPALTSAILEQDGTRTDLLY